MPVFGRNAAKNRGLQHRTDSEIESDAVAGRPLLLTRNELYCGLAIVGFANGVSERAGDEIARSGVAGAFFNTFGVSVVVWAALIVVLWLLLRAKPERVRRADIAVGAVASVAFLVPVPSLAWLAVAGTAAHLVWTSAPRSRLRRAAVVLGALTVPMLWARLLFGALSNTLLSLDAKLVGWLVGVESTGNAIPFADGSGLLFLEPACSSLTNVSLALLCGVIFVKAYDRPWTGSILATMLLACIVTVAINVMRISVIGVLPATYELMHGGIGATLAAWATIIAVTLIYTKWIKPDAPDPA
ncbi:hypothetical protein [Mesorhizobium sp. 1B3]|uniref:hypothetical protein n=1 Tax=Mesorhizobium sp. 1B3 TaxID=3243599 RepID=UPI003D971DFE